MAPTTSDLTQRSSDPHASLSEEVIAIVTVFQALSTLTLALRLWTRLRIQHLRPGPDDWVILTAWALDLALGTIIGFRMFPLYSIGSGD